MHDGRVAHSIPTVSDFVFANVNIACSCSDCMNHSKECACKHENDGRMFWILDPGTSTHFTLHCLDFVDMLNLKVMTTPLYKQLEVSYMSLVVDMC